MSLNGTIKIVDNRCTTYGVTYHDFEVITSTVKLIQKDNKITHRYSNYLSEAIEEVKLSFIDKLRFLFGRQIRCIFRVTIVDENDEPIFDNYKYLNIETK